MNKLMMAYLLECHSGEDTTFAKTKKTFDADNSEVFESIKLLVQKHILEETEDGVFSSNASEEDIIRVREEFDIWLKAIPKEKSAENASNSDMFMFSVIEFLNGKNNGVSYAELAEKKEFSFQLDITLQMLIDNGMVVFHNDRYFNTLAPGDYYIYYNLMKEQADDKKKMLRLWNVRCELSKVNGKASDANIDSEAREFYFNYLSKKSGEEKTEVSRFLNTMSEFDYDEEREEEDNENEEDFFSGLTSRIQRVRDSKKASKTTKLMIPKPDFSNQSIKIKIDAPVYDLLCFMGYEDTPQMLFERVFEYDEQFAICFFKSIKSYAKYTRKKVELDLNNCEWIMTVDDNDVHVGFTEKLIDQDLDLDSLRNKTTEVRMIIVTTGDD